MMNNSRIALAAVLASIGCIAFTVSAGSGLEPLPVKFFQAPDGLTPEIAKLVRAVAEAKSALKASEASEKLFKGADRKKLAQLKQVKEDSVALRAAWHEIFASGTPRTIKHPEAGVAKAVDQAASARFLGFVEGRLRIALPKWWEPCATDAYRIHDADDALFAGYPTSPYEQNKKPRMAVTAGASVRIAEGKTTVRYGKDDVVLSRDLADKYVMGRQGNLSVLLDRDCLFLAAHGDVGYSYPLACIDRSTGRKKWEATVWGLGLEGGATGLWYQYASIIANGDSVFVFGFVCRCCYLEGFDRNTGSCLFRFSID